MVDRSNLREPGAGAKCRTEAVNEPGFLTVRTFVSCAADQCVVNGAGDTHTVRISNDSPQRYLVDLSAWCTEGVTFVHDGAQQSTWAVTGVQVTGRRKSRRGRLRLELCEPGRAPDVDRRLVALRRGDDEVIEVAVSWSCIGHPGEGQLRPPLVIQLDARPATP